MDAGLLPARVSDAAVLCERTAAPRFLGFLTPAETAVATALLKKSGSRYCYFGGYDAAERTVLACLPDWCDEPEFPITAVTFHYRSCDRLSHRDFLGALMGLGLTRESVGDILVEPGRAVVFLLNDIAKFAVSQTEKVGSVGVTSEIGAVQPLPQASRKVSATDTVASLRLDCVVAALCGCSRKTAAMHIADGNVSVRSVACEKATHTVSEGDTVAVRGVGKFTVDRADTFSKKGRIILQYSKYV